LSRNIQMLPILHLSDRKLILAEYGRRSSRTARAPILFGSRHPIWGAVAPGSLPSGQGQHLQIATSSAAVRSHAYHCGAPRSMHGEAPTAFKRSRFCWNLGESVASTTTAECARCPSSAPTSSSMPSRTSAASTVPASPATAGQSLPMTVPRSPSTPRTISLRSVSNTSELTRHCGQLASTQAASMLPSLPTTNRWRDPSRIRVRASRRAGELSARRAAQCGRGSTKRKRDRNFWRAVSRVSLGHGPPMTATFCKSGGNKYSAPKSEKVDELYVFPLGWGLIAFAISAFFGETLWLKVPA